MLVGSLSYLSEAPGSRAGEDIQGQLKMEQEYGGIETGSAPLTVENNMVPGDGVHQDFVGSSTAHDDNSRAVTGGIPGTELHNTVHELLKCPVCLHVMSPPIYQCPNGHTLCFNCKTGAYNCCPICHQELGNLRCLSLENVANLVELPCRYQLLGCPFIFTHQSRLSHEQNCRFRPYGCPYDGAACLANGDIQFLVMHLKDDHNVEMHDGCTFNHRYVNSNPQEFANATWMLTVMQCFGHHFCLDFQSFYIKKAPVYMAILRFMGDEDEAKKFRYSLEFGDDKRKLTWIGVPRSIRDSTKTVRESSDGLIIYRNMAHSLSGDYGQEVKIKVVGRIWKEE